VLAAPAPGRAQRFGQWSWDGRLAGDVQDARTEREGDEQAVLDQRELRLELGLEGFVVHPALASFRLSGSLGLTGVETTHSRLRRRWGFGAELAVLPRGSRSLRLYARRALYDESLEGVREPTPVVGFPESETSFGGRIRLRRGFLRGSLMGYDRTAIDYRGDTRGLTGREQAFYQWNRPNPDLNQHLRLERRADRFGFSDYSTETLKLNYDQRARLGTRWTWQSTNVGTRRVHRHAFGFRQRPVQPGAPPAGRREQPRPALRPGPGRIRRRRLPEPRPAGTLLVAPELGVVSLAGAGVLASARPWPLHRLSPGGSRRALEGRGRSDRPRSEQRSLPPPAEPDGTPG
jgi:hypothetical protein